MNITYTARQSIYDYEILAYGVIYKITNKLDGKDYVGKCSAEYLMERDDGLVVTKRFTEENWKKLSEIFGLPVKYLMKCED